MDLNFWTGKTYTDPPFRVAFKVILGAKKWRCEYCRLNFASFRKRKEVFSFKRWKRFGQQAEEHAPHPAEEQDKKKIAGDKIASATKCVQGSRHD